VSISTCFLFVSLLILKLFEFLPFFIYFCAIFHKNLKSKCHIFLDFLILVIHLCLAPYDSDVDLVLNDQSLNLKPLWADYINNSRRLQNIT
jgi:hypothetical protein